MPIKSSSSLAAKGTKCAIAFTGLLLMLNAQTVLAEELNTRASVIPPKPVGVSMRVQNSVNASLGDRRLRESDSVFASESIEAGPNSFGEILLNDDSKVLVGENSSILLDDFVTGSQGFASGSIRVSKGAFRFITGNSQKGFLKVESPVSTIGVRGTLFDVYVTDSGVTRVVLFRGEVEVCSGGNCVITDNACDVVEANGNGVEELPYLRSGDRETEKEAYKLAHLQKRFNKAWRAPTFNCAVRAFFDPKLRRNNQPSRGFRSGAEPGREPPPSGPAEPAGTSPCASLRLPSLQSGTLLAQVTGPPGADPCT